RIDGCASAWLGQAGRPCPGPVPPLQGRDRRVELLRSGVLLSDRSVHEQRPVRPMDFVRLTAEQRRAMDEDGFLVVPGALDGEMVSRAEEAVDRLAHAFL